MSDPRPMPPFASWPSFPFEGEFRLRELDEPTTEPAREGEEPSECRACNTSDESYIWVSERWRVRSLDRPSGLPGVFILEPRSHLDLGDLPNLLSAELGVMTVRLERAVRSLDGVARVHVNRWGDATAHLHLWFLARPLGRPQLQGTFLSVWNDILPPISEYQWRENLALVAAWLAEFGGRSIAEPPHIEWKSPARIGAADEPATGAMGTPSGKAADASVPEWGAGVVEGGAGQLDRPAIRPRQRSSGSPARLRDAGGSAGQGTDPVATKEPERGHDAVQDRTDAAADAARATGTAGGTLTNGRGNGSEASGAAPGETLDVGTAHPGAAYPGAAHPGPHPRRPQQGGAPDSGERPAGDLVAGDLVAGDVPAGDVAAGGTTRGPAARG